MYFLTTYYKKQKQIGECITRSGNLVKTRREERECGAHEEQRYGVLATWLKQSQEVQTV